MSDEKTAELEEEIKKLKRQLFDKEDEDERDKRADFYRLSRVDKNLASQEIHGNLSGLNADNHTQYLNNARHDLIDRHGDAVIGGPYLNNATHDLIARHGDAVIGGPYLKQADGATANVTVVTSVDFVAETVTTLTLQFVNGQYVGST